MCAIWNLVHDSLCQSCEMLVRKPWLVNLVAEAPPHGTVLLSSDHTVYPASLQQGASTLPKALSPNQATTLVKPLPNLSSHLLGATKLCPSVLTAAPHETLAPSSPPPHLPTSQRWAKPPAEAGENSLTASLFASGFATRVSVARGK